MDKQLMRRIISASAFIVLLCHRLSGQASPILIAGVGVPSGGGGTPVFVQPSSGATGISTSSVTSAAATTTSGNTLFVFFGIEEQCNLSNVFNGFAISDTANDTFTPIFPTGQNAVLLSGTVTNGGSGYTSGATCTISGGGGAATCVANVTGGVVQTITMQGTTSYFTSAPTLTITPSVPTVGSGATGSVVGYGFFKTAGTECVAGFYASNITGTTNNQVTGSIVSGGSYAGVSVQEMSGAGTNPFVAAVSGVNSGTSVTAGAFGTGASGQLVACGSRVEALTQTWSPGSGYTIPPGVGGTGTNSYTSGQYNQNFNPNGTTPSMSSGSSADREILCASFQ